MPPSFEPRESKSSAGPTIGIILILFLMLLGAVYFWYQHENQQPAVVPYITSGTSTISTQ